MLLPSSAAQSVACSAIAFIIWRCILPLSYTIGSHLQFQPTEDKYNKSYRSKLSKTMKRKKQKKKQKVMSDALQKYQKAIMTAHSSTPYPIVHHIMPIRIR